MITSSELSVALDSWSNVITQEKATLLVTEAFLSLPERPNLSIYRIEYIDGTVDYSAWRRNRINIFQRWRKRRTNEQREKFDALRPAILAAIGKDNAGLFKQLTAGNSIEFLVSRLLKESTEAINASLLGASVTDVDRECEEAARAISALQQAYRHQQRHDH